MIYFIQSLDKIKIGYTSNNVMERKRGMETGNPHGMIVIGLVDGDKTHEHKIHSALDEYCAFGEWFFDCNEVRKYISDILNGKKVVKYKQRMMHPYGKIDTPLQVKEISTSNPEWLDDFISNNVNKSKELSDISVGIRDIEIKICHLLADKKNLELKYLKTVKN